MTTDQTLLYHYADENISVVINIFFKEGNFVVSGIDKGPTVLHKTGKHAFNYSLAITEKYLPQLYQYLDLSSNDGKELIAYFTDNYAINTCISEIGTLLHKSDVPFEYNSWH